MHIVVLSGGVGSRLWPLSRDHHPKPFIEFKDNESLLKKVYIRSLQTPSLKSITTVTNASLLSQTKKEYQNIDFQPLNTLKKYYIAEPFGRNTAPATALAALLLEQEYTLDSTLLILPSDHLIADEAAFMKAIEEAEKMARAGKIVTFGIKPNFPETGYGYIHNRGNEVIEFVEKPTFDKAVEYLESGDFLWNSGMFCFSVKTILNEMENLCPDILAAARDTLQASKKIQTELDTTIYIQSKSFLKVPSVSIDYAVMEKTDKISVFPCEIGWSDIGTWSAVKDLSEVDSSGNSLSGKVVVHDVKNSYIHTTASRVIGAVGLSDLIIVDTPDALLISDSGKTQYVKDIYSQLKKEDNETCQSHITVTRPWGSYTILEDTEHCKTKRIEVEAGASLSLQMHHKRSEHWVVVSGEALVVNGNDEFQLNVGESTFIPAGNKHRLTNIGDEKLIIIEVQTGSYFGEDDIVRFEDNYERVERAA